MTNFEGYVLQGVLISWWGSNMSIIDTMCHECVDHGRFSLLNVPLHTPCYR